MISPFQRLAHVLGHGPGDHQDIGVARRCNKADAEPLDVVIRIVQGMDLKLAAVARASIDLADRETFAEALPGGASDRCRQSRIAAWSGEGAGSVSGPANRL